MAMLIMPDHKISLTENQQKNPPIGFGAAALKTFSYPLTDPFVLLIVSDGVWKYLGVSEMIRISRASKPEQIPEVLLQRMDAEWQTGLPDDFSVIVVSSSGG
jgi:serine/threonine protein phosphatase PrpC